MPKKLTPFCRKFAKPLAASALLSSFFVGTANANPSGADVQSGQVNFQGGAGHLTVQQFTEKAIVNWQKFGIGQGESVRFLQPSQLSVILNRVVGQDPSHILGQMNANGNVWIINPNGVLFGPQSQINVGGLVASTLNISNEDFLNGNFRFTQDQNKALASVVNQGSITITDGGYAVLMAPLVSNEGMIVANLGQVNLMSGESATLNFDGRNLISYDIGHMNEANPGTVMVDRSTVGSLLANVINDPNLTEAGSIVENPDGSVSLVNAADTVVNSGTIQANGADGQKAGKIVLESGRLTVVGEGSQIEASGQGVDSDGGEIIALSHGTMKLEEGGRIEARGSAQGGDGGFIDTSGLGRIILEDYADANAPNGDGGQWLIDPEFLAIISGDGGQLDGDTDTTGDGGQSSSISEDFLEGLSGNQTVTLQADNQLTINDLADDVLTFQDDVSVELISGTGNILFAAPEDGIQVGGTGGITIDAGRDLILGNLVSTGTGTIDITFARDLIDGNGAGTVDIVGDFLTFDTTGGSAAVDVSGFSQSNPVQFNLTTNNSNDFTANIIGGANGQPVVANTLSLVSGTLSSTDLQTPSPSTGTGVGTTVNLTHTGALSVDGLQVAEANITASGNVDGTGLTADNANVTGSNINGLTANIGGANADDGVLTLTGNAVTATVNDGGVSNVTDLTVQVNGGDVSIGGSTATAALTGGTFTYTEGANDNDFTLIDTAATDIEIGGTVTGSDVSLTTAGSILNTGGNTISADNIELVTTGAGQSIGEFTTPQAILVEGEGGAGTQTALSISVVDGPVNVEHSDADPSFVTFNNPADAEADLLQAADPGSDSFSSIEFNRTGAGDIILGVLGSSTDVLNGVILSTANGSILNSTTAPFAAGDTNIFSSTINMVALGGSIGLVGDPIEVSSSDITAQADNGVFIANQQDLEVFSLITDAGGEASITATNGSLTFTGGTLSATGITDIVGGEEPGDTDGDGYDVTLDVTVTNGDVTLGAIDINGAGDGTDDGAQGQALVRVVNQNGNIDGGGPLTLGANTDVTLRSETGSIGAGTAVSMSTASAGEGDLLLDAVTGIDVNVTAGQFDTVTVEHTNPTVVSVAGTSGMIDSAGLDITGAANVSTINYTIRNGDIAINDIDTNSTTDINITAQAGNVTGAATAAPGANDIDAGANTVTVNASGDFTASAASGAGSLEIGTVGGTATLVNNDGLSLNTAAAGTVGGDLNVDNDAALIVGDVAAGGNATITNSATIANDGDSTTDLTAANLTITADGVGTSVDLDTMISGSITLEDCIADGGGNATLINIFNDGAFDSLTIESDSTDNLVVSTDGDTAAEDVRLANGIIAANDAQITTVSIHEKSELMVDTAGTASFNNSTDVTINASSGFLNGDYDVTGGGGADRNLTLLAQSNMGDFGLTTTVEGTLTFTSQVGTIIFVDDQTDGPDDLIVTTVAGNSVDGTWDAGQSTLTYGSGSGRLVLTDLASADTNVTFQTDTGDIEIEFADVGNCRNGDLNDLTLIATAGSILDEGDPGGVGALDPTTLVFANPADAITDAALDIRANNATLLAQGDIGTSADPLEVDVCDTLTARSDTGGVFTSSNETVDHIIVDVNEADYDVTFAEYGTGDSVNINYTGATTNTLTVTNGVNAGRFQGTDLTLIERGTVDVEIGSNMDNTAVGDVDGGGDDEFVRIISGGGITNMSGSTITSDNGDLIGQTGDLGSAAAPILFSVQDLCVSASGRDVVGFVENTVDVRNLYLSVNQSNGGAGDVSVIWPGGGGNGVRMDGATLSTVSDLAGTAGTAGTADVVVVNGAFELDGEFGVDPDGNNETFSRVSDSIQRDSMGNINSGGDVIIGTYESDGNLEVQARGVDLGGTTGTSDGGDIIQGAGGSIDVGSNTVTLVSEHGAIGTTTAAVEIVSSNNDTVVNAYTENESNVTGGDITGDEAGDININSTGDVEFNQVISGTDLTFIAPFHDNDQPAFTPGGVQAPALATPGVAPPTPPREGDVIITGDGEICATDVRGGADSDVMIESTGAGDILVGTVAAANGTVTITNASGDIDEKEDNTDGNIFAQEFVGNITGTGTIGDRSNATDKLRESLDIVVLESSIDVADGDVFLRNIGNIIYNDVSVEKTTNAVAEPGQVYLVSEGVTTAGNIEAGNTTNVDVLVETLNGSQLLVGNVQALGNTVTLKSSDSIRTDARALDDSPFANQGRVQADNVLLLSNGDIGTAATPMQIFASTDGGTVTVAASTLNGSNDGTGTATNPTRGSIFLDAGSATFATDIVIGTVTDNICNLTETGVVDAANICIDAENGDITVTDGDGAGVDNMVDASNVAELEASDDITLESTVDGNNRVGIEAGTDGTGSIIDNHTTGEDVDGTQVGLRAGTDVGAAGDPLEIQASTFAAEATNGLINVVSENGGDLTLGTVDLKTGSVTGMSSAGDIDLVTNGRLNVDAAVSSTMGDICLDVGGVLDVNANITASGGNVVLESDGNALLGDGTAGIVTASDTIAVISGGSITDGNGGTDNLVASDLVMEAAGGIGSNAGGGGDNDLEIQADRLAADAQNGDVNVIDGTGDLEIADLSTAVTGITRKDGSDLNIVGVSATEDVCIDVTAGALTLTEAVNSTGSMIALRANGDIDLDVAGNGALTAEDKISIESVTGGLNGLEAGGGADLVTTDAGGEVVIRTANGIGTQVAPLEVSTDFFAAQTTNAAAAGIFVEDADGLTITQIALEKASGDVTGIQTAGDVCVETTTGDLVVERTVSGDNVFLRTADGNILNNIAVNENIEATGATGQAILEANGAALGTGEVRDGTDGNGAIVGFDVVLNSVNGVGETGLDVEVDATNLAAQSTSTGAVNIDEIGTGATNIAEITYDNKDGVGQTTVTGVQAAAEVCIDTAGQLNVNESIVTTAGGIAIRADGAVIIGDGAADANVEQLVAGGAAQLVSIETVGAGNDIQDNNGDDNAAIVTTGGDVVMRAGGSIGTTDFAGTAEVFEIEAARLAAQSGDDINIRDIDIATADGLQVNAAGLALAKGGGTIQGVTAANDVCLDTLGNLDLDQVVEGTAGSVALDSRNGNVTLGDAVNAGDTVSIEANGDITDDSATAGDDIDATTVVLNSGGDIEDVDIDAATVAARATGAVDITAENGAGTDVTVGSADILKGGGGTITGITAGDEVCVEVGDGDNLVVTEAVSAGDGIALRAAGDVDLNNTVSTSGANIVGIAATGGEITDGNGATVNVQTAAGGSVVMTSGTGIGNADDIEIDTTTFAANSTAGDVNVVDLDTNTADGLVIGAVTDTLKGITATGVTAGGDVCIDVADGSLDVNQAISGTNVALRTRDDDNDNDGNINLNGVDVTATTTASLESADEILDNSDAAGTIIATSVILDADTGIGNDTDATPLTGDLQIDASNIAADGGTGDVNITDGALSNTNAGLTVIEGTPTLKGGATVDGITAGGEICLDVDGNLNVNADMAAGGNVAIEATGNIVLGDTVGQTGVIVSGNGLATDTTSTVSIEAGGDVTDGNGAGVVNIRAQADVGGTVTDSGDLVVDAGSFGVADTDGAAPDTSAPIDVQVGRLAGQATAGDFSVDDLEGDLQIAEGLSTLKTPTTFSGVTATADICLDATAGDLEVDADLSAGENVALGAADNIVLGDADGAQDGVVTAGGAGFTVSVEARAGSISDGQGDGSIAPLTNNIENQGGSVVMRGGTGVGTLAESIEINALNFAANGGTGDVSVFDLDLNSDGLVLTTIDTLKDNIEIDGIETIGDICITTIGDDIEIIDNLISGGDVALFTDQNVILGDGAGVDRGVIVAGAGADMMVGGGDDVQGTISIEAGGNVIDNNGDLTTDGGDVDNFADGANLIALEGGNVVITAGGSIGDGDAIEIDAGTVAATANGAVNLTEQDIITQDGLIVGEVDTLKGLTTVTGVTSDTAEVCIDVLDGDLNINEDVMAGGGAAHLRSAGNVTIGNDDTLGAGDAAADQVTATTQVIIEAGGDITDGNGDGNAAAVALTGDVILNAGGTIGDAVFAPGAPAAGTLFEIDTQNLAAASGGDVNILDLDSDNLGLNVVERTYTDKDGTPTTITGVTAVDDICLDVVNGSLEVDQVVTSVGGSIALQTQGAGADINLNGFDVTAQTADETVSLESSNSINDSVDGAGSVVATNVVLQATETITATDAGATGVGVEVDAANLAAATTNGNIDIEATNTAGTDVTIADLDTLKGGEDITGIDAGGEVCLDVTTDNLQISEDITARNGQVHLEADGNVTVGDDNTVAAGDADADQVTATSRVVIEAGGDIADNNGDGNAAVVVLGGDVVLNAGGTIGDAVFAPGTPAAGTLFEIDADDLAASSGGDVNILDLDSNNDGLDVEEITYTDKDNNATTITGVTAVNDICVDVVNGSLDVNQVVTSTDGSIALQTQGAGADINLNGFDVTAQTADETVSLESSNSINDSADGTGSLVATNVVLQATQTITATDLAGTGVGVEVDAANLAAATTNGNIDIEATNTAGTDVTIADLDTLKGGEDITGIDAGGEVCLDVTTDNLQISEDITARNGQVHLEADGNVTVGDDNTVAAGDADADQVTATSRVVIEAGGDIADNNGDGNAAVVVLGGDVVLNAGGTIGDAVFAPGTPAAGTLFEIDAEDLAASSGGDVNILDLDSNSDGLDVEEITYDDKDGNSTTITGVTAANDICIDVVNGSLDVNQVVTSTAGSIALQTQGAGADINLNGFDVTAQTADETVSLESSNSINDSVDGTGSLVATNVVLQATETITATDVAGTGVGVEVNAANLAAVTTNGNIDIEATNAAGTDVTVADLDTLKGGEDVTGIDAGGEVCLDVTTDNLQINEDVTARNGAAHLEADGNITVGNDNTLGAGDAAADQVTATTQVIMEAGGDITDNNGDGNAAAVALTGDVILNAGGTIGDAAFATGVPAAGTLFEIDAEDLAASSGGDVNILDLDSNSDGLDVEELTYTDKDGNSTTITGVTAANDVCLDVVNGSLDINQVVTGTAGSVALQTQGAGSNINLNGFDVTAANVASLETDGEIIDTVDGAGAVVATDVVMDAENGIGNDGGAGVDVEVNATSFAAITRTAGDVNVEDIAGGMTVAEDLFTLKAGTEIDGVTAVADVCIDVTGGDLTVAADIDAGNDVALRAGGNVVLGDAAGLEEGVVTAGNNAAEVGVISVESGGEISDGNGATTNLVTNNLGVAGTGDVILDADAGVGSTGDNAIEITAARLAAGGGTGDVNVTDVDGDLQITELTTLKGGETITGIEDAADVCIDVLVGNMEIDRQIDATGNIALRAEGNITNSIAVAGEDVETTGANGTVSVESNGEIIDDTDGTGAFIGTNVVMDAENGIGNDGGAGVDVEINATNFAAITRTAGDVNVEDIAGDLNVVENLTTLKGGDDIDGITAVEDICLDVTDAANGNLTVAGNMTAGDDVAIRAEGNVVLGDTNDDDNGQVIAGTNAAEVGVISIESGGEISDGNGAVTNLIANDAAGGTAGDVVLDSANGIGSTGDDAIEMEAGRFAAGGGTGDVNVTDVTGDLQITELTTIKGGEVITGIEDAVDVCVDVVVGNMEIDRQIDATGNIALRAEGNITNSIAQAGEDVETTGANGTVSVESNGEIIDDTDGTGAFIGTNVVMDAENGIGNDGGAGVDVEINATNFAAITRTAGDVNVEDIAGDLNVVENLTTLKGGDDIDGITAVEDICLDVTDAANGNLTVAGDMTAGDDVAIRAEGNVVLGDTNDDDNGQVIAGTNAAEVGVISIESGGEISDGNGAVTNLIANDAAGGTAGDVVLDSANGIGSTGDDAIEMEAGRFAAGGGTGDVNVTDVTGDLQITELTTIKGGETITGIEDAVDVCVDVVVGNMEIDRQIDATGNIALRAEGNITNSIAVAGEDVETTGANGTVSVESNGEIIDDTDGTGAFIGTNVVMDAENGIGNDGGAGVDVEINATNFAAITRTAGDVNVEDIAGGATIAELATLKGGDTVTGVTAVEDVCLEITGGDLNIDQGITGANVALRADNVNMNGASDVTATDANGTVSVESNGEITDTGDGSFVGENVVLSADQDIGGAAAVTVDATNLAAASANGRVNIQDIAGGATITTLNTLKGGDTIAGVTAATDVCIDVVGGELVIDEAVTAGTVAAIKADGSIASNATVTGNDKVSVETGGEIVDGNGAGDNFVGSQVGIKANGNIGSKADAIDINSDVVAAQSVIGEVNLNETTGDLNIGTVALEKNGGTLAGVQAASDVCLTADDGTVTYTGDNAIRAANEIAIRTRDDFSINGRLEPSNANGRVSIEVTNGSIIDNNDGVDIRAEEAAIKASGNIGTTDNPVDTDLERIGIESTTGSLNIREVDGLKVTSVDLAKSGGTLNGATAGDDVLIQVDEGDLELETVRAGDDVTLLVQNGNITDCNDDDPNIIAGGDAILAAPRGCVEIPAGDIEVVGSTTIIQLNKGERGDIPLPPGVFAQDNVGLGESSLYLDILHGYVTPDQLQLIIDEINAYRYFEDGDFLLEKHPTTVRAQEDNEDN